MIQAVEPFKPRDTKPVLTDVREARYALASDKLGVVYHRVVPGRGVVVFVVTAFGAGEFTVEQWEVGS